MPRISHLVQEVRALLEAKKEGRSAATVVENKLGQILLLQRGSTAPWMPNKWSLPGGVVDPGETPEAAAKREAKEEVGITPLGMKLLWMGPIPGLENEDLYVYHSKTYSGEPKLSDTENSGFKWVSKVTAWQEDLVPPLPAILKKLVPKTRVKQVGGSGNKGQFARTDGNQMCKCGHRFGDHTAGSPYECLGPDYGGCDQNCEKFRPVKAKKPTAESGVSDNSKK